VYLLIKSGLVSFANTRQSKLVKSEKGGERERERERAVPQKGPVWSMSPLRGSAQFSDPPKSVLLPLLPAKLTAGYFMRNTRRK